MVGAGGTVAILGAVLALFTGANRWALGILLLSLVADLAFGRLLAPSGARRAPALLLIAGVPALAAAAAAYYLAR